MSEREAILARIRKAVAIPSPKPGAHQGSAANTPPPSQDESFRSVLPEAATTFEQKVAQFQANALDLKAEFFLVSDLREMADILAKLRTSEGWKKAASHRGELTDTAIKALGLLVCQTDAAYNVNELESCDVGISECDALIAQTGSVLITSRTAGGRALSVLPPYHVVLARRDQLLSDLPEAFALIKSKYGANYPSMISFITGPSRTGDIERILVLGAHGPKKLTIICV